MRYLLILSFLFSCARAPLENKKEALRLVVTDVVLSDDLPLLPFIEGIRQSIKVLEKNHLEYIDFQFGERNISKANYISSLKGLLKQFQMGLDKESFLKYIKLNFDFYEVYGKDKHGEILLTSYFSPIIKGSLKKTKQYSRPLYSLPKDLVKIPLLPYEEEDFNFKFEAKNKSLMGRLVDGKKGNGMKEIIPFFSREEIDIKNALKGRKLEICYVDPIDSFFLQIQGSGSIILDNGKKISVGYHGQNGRKYFPIGKLLLDEIPLEEMSMQKIVNHLRSLRPALREELMAKNPSYVFFDGIKGRPRTTLGTEVVDGRTLATDLKFFPKGAIGFLEFRGNKRLILDHDTGGAIYGGGRADLFWGLGDEAQAKAGKLRELAKLYFLAPKN